MPALSHPWLDGRFPHVASLSPTQRLYTFLAANTAAGSLDGVRRDWACLQPQHQHSGLEVILQTHLFAGFPRAINAFAVAHEVGVDRSVMKQLASVDREDWAAEGESLCRTIYGDAYEPLRQRMAALHPHLDGWMVELGYGRVLSRPGLTPRERELCVIAVLAGQNVPQQLHSHLRGAQRVGATPEECATVLAQTETIWGAQAQAAAWAVWRHVQSAS